MCVVPPRKARKTKMKPVDFHRLNRALKSEQGKPRMFVL